MEKHFIHKPYEIKNDWINGFFWRTFFWNFTFPFQGHDYSLPTTVVNSKFKFKFQYHGIITSELPNKRIQSYSNCTDKSGPLKMNKLRDSRQFTEDGMYIVPGQIIHNKSTHHFNKFRFNTLVQFRNSVSLRTVCMMLASEDSILTNFKPI